MKAHILGFTDGKKIQAIKGIRAVAGLGLKEAKDIADQVVAGGGATITMSPHDGPVLVEHGVRFEVIPVTVPLADLTEVLDRYPPAMTVGELVEVLRVVSEHPEVTA